MSMENLVVITVMMGDVIDFKKVRQFRRPYSNSAVMIPYRNKELGTGSIIAERETLECLRKNGFKTDFNIVKFAVQVAKDSYVDRHKPLANNKYGYIHVHRVKDETVILRLDRSKFGKEDIIFTIKPAQFDKDGHYEWLERIGKPE